MKTLPDRLIAGKRRAKSYTSAPERAEMSSLLRVLMTALFLWIVSMLVFAQRSSADIYKYVDKNGTVVLTDDLNKVPEEHRREVVVIREPQKDGKGKPSEKAAKGERDSGRGKGKGEEGFQWEKIKRTLTGITKGRLLLPALAVVLYFVLFVLIGNICSFFEQRKLGFVLRIVLTVGLLIYLSKAF